MDVDIVIVGAGPSGLCLARSLSGQGLNIAVIEQQPMDATQTHYLMAGRLPLRNIQPAP